MKKIGITLGETCGIGPQIVVRTLKNLPTSASYVLFGSPKLLAATADFYHAGSLGERFEIRSIGPDQGRFEKSETSLRAKAVLETLDAASEACLQGELSALVTSPIDKSIVRTLIPDFTGHTEYLAQKADVTRTVMCLDNSEMRVVLVTNHLPLRDVSKAVTANELERTIEVACKGLSRWFGISQPKIAVAGLNPHAGEIVSSSEEETVMKPVIEKLRSMKVDIEGPFAADSLFPLARNGKWDLIVSPYHDQGLVAAKYPGLDKVVNITLGLPYLRVSPGHGVAYDLAPETLADTRSFERAVRTVLGCLTQ